MVYFLAQDIASLVFQSVSICCFLIVIIHVVYTRIFNPKMSLRARDCLSLISSASTTFLFIFYIALGTTVYTSPETKNTQVCFLSASVLMFLVYFFLIFMFCIKTSIAYFTYINFVHLFPAPSFRKLYITMISSFVISITYVAFAAGFNSNSSFGITQLYVKKICWFTQRVIHYFVTIPICACLLLNIIMLIFVVKTTNRTHKKFYYNTPNASTDDTICTSFNRIMCHSRYWLAFRAFFNICG